MNIPLSQIEEAIESGEYLGYCLSCGNEQGECEPDARNYPCDACGELKVHGAEDILLMGRVDEDA